jgi:hypothetical protein
VLSGVPAPGRTAVGSDTFSMRTNVYVGLAGSRHDTTRAAAATFDNVSLR